MGEKTDVLNMHYLMHLIVLLWFYAKILNEDVLACS